MIKYIKKETNIVIKLAKAPWIARRILVEYMCIDMMYVYIHKLSYVERAMYGKW